MTISRWIRRRARSAVVAAACGVLPAPAAAQSLTLTEALDLAERNHPTLVAADARMTAAEESGAAARGARLPGLALTGSLTRHQEPMVVAPLHELNLGSPPAFDRTLVQGQLGIRYTLYDGGATGSRIRAADAGVDATEVMRTSAEMRVLEETVRAFVGLTTARTVLEASRAQVAALEAERARVERHLAAGSAAQVELLTADAVLEEARAEEAGAMASVGLAERTLARLMGVEPAALAERSVVPLAPPNEPARGDAAASPVVLQAERTVEVAEARLTEERAGRLPTVQAGAGLLDFGAWEREHALEWRAGVEVSWPVFTGSRGAAVRSANAQVVAAQADLRTARLTAAQEADQAVTAITTADARAAALAAAVTRWEEVARIEALALEAGSGEQRDLLRAEAGLYQARAGHATATRDAIAARLRLASAEGVLDRAWINQWMESP